MRTAIRRHKLLLASLALGLSALVLSYTTVSSYVRSGPVVVAAKDLEPYSKIAPGDVSIVQLPVKAVPRNSYRNLGDVLGAYTRSRVVEGQVIMAGHVASGKDEAGLSYDLPSDKRAMFLPVPAPRALGGLLKKGEKVDVLFALKGILPGGIGVEPAAVTGLRNLPVVEVVTDPSSGEFQGVVVFASPEDCARLAGYLDSAAVYLSLAPRVALAEETKTDVWPPR